MSADPPTSVRSRRLFARLVVEACQTSPAEPFVDVNDHDVARPSLGGSRTSQEKREGEGGKSDEVRKKPGVWRVF
jgi:hypothetical protein